MKIEQKRFLFYVAICMFVMLMVILPLTILGDYLPALWKAVVWFLIVGLMAFGFFIWGYARQLKLERIWRPVLNRMIHADIRKPK